MKSWENGQIIYEKKDKLSPFVQDEDKKLVTPLDYVGFGASDQYTLGHWTEFDKPQKKDKKQHVFFMANSELIKDLERKNIPSLGMQGWEVLHRHSFEQNRQYKEMIQLQKNTEQY